MNYHTVTHPAVSPNLHFPHYSQSVLCGLATRLPSSSLFLRCIFYVFLPPPDLIQSSLSLHVWLWQVCQWPEWPFLPLLLFSASCVAADIISTVEFNSTGELLATGDKGGRVVVFQREQEVWNANSLPPVYFFNWEQKCFTGTFCFKLHLFWH